MSLSGQWVARYTGANSGTIVIEIDEIGDHYEGAACEWDSNSKSSKLVGEVPNALEETFAGDARPAGRSYG